MSAGGYPKGSKLNSFTGDEFLFLSSNQEWHGGWVLSTYCDGYGAPHPCNGTINSPYEEEDYNNLSNYHMWIGGWVVEEGYIFPSYISATGAAFRRRDLEDPRFGSVDYPIPLDIYEEMCELGLWEGGYVIQIDDSIEYVELGENEGDSGSGSEGDGSGSEGDGSGSEGDGSGSEEEGGDHDSFINIVAGQKVFSVFHDCGVAFMVVASWTNGQYYSKAGYSTSHIALSYYSHFNGGTYSYIQGSFQSSAHWVNHLRFSYRIEFRAEKNKLTEYSFSIEDQSEAQTSEGSSS